MKRPSPVLLVTLAAAALLWLLSRTQKGQAVVAEVADAVASGVLGYRLNNPLNVERGQDWQGLAPDQWHARFAHFVSMPYGIRAWHKIMQTYSKSYGVRSVAAIVNRYNPKVDGQPGTYIPTVAAAVGVSADASFDVMSPALAFKLCRAMIRVEIGAPAALLVSDDDVRQGLRLAGVAV